MALFVLSFLSWIITWPKVSSKSCLAGNGILGLALQPPPNQIYVYTNPGVSGRREFTTPTPIYMGISTRMFGVRDCVRLDHHRRRRFTGSTIMISGFSSRMNLAYSSGVRLVMSWARSAIQSDPDKCSISLISLISMSNDRV